MSSYDIQAAWLQPSTWTWSVGETTVVLHADGKVTYTGSRDQAAESFWAAVEHAGLGPLAAKNRRIQDLLEANNRYLERARKAEAEVERLKAESRPLYSLPGPDWKSDGQGYLVSPDGLTRVLIAPHAAPPIAFGPISTFTIGGEATSISPQTVWKSDRS